MRQLLLSDSYMAPPGGPTLLFGDNFNRADAATLGASWNEHGDAWSVASNAAHPPALSGFRFVSHDVAANGMDIRVKISTNPASANDLALLARYIDSGNHILFNVVMQGGVHLCRVFEKTGGGGYSGLTSLISPVPWLTNNDHTPFYARIVVGGSYGANNGEAFLTDQSDYNTWISVGTFTSNVALNGGTEGGLAAGDSAASAFDDFEIYTS